MPERLRGCFKKDHPIAGTGAGRSGRLDSPAGFGINFRTSGALRYRNWAMEDRRGTGENAPRRKRAPLARERLVPGFKEIKNEEASSCRLPFFCRHSCRLRHHGPDGSRRWPVLDFVFECVGLEWCWAAVGCDRRRSAFLRAKRQEGPHYFHVVDRCCCVPVCGIGSGDVCLRGYGGKRGSRGARQRDLYARG